MFLLQGTRHKEVCCLIKNLDIKMSSLETKFDEYFVGDCEVGDEF